MHLRGHSFDIEVRVISILGFDALLGRDSLTQFSEVTLKTGGKGPSLVLSLQQSKTKVENIIKAYADCFDKPLKDSQLKIEPEPIIDLTNDTVPIRCPTRRYSDADGKMLHETVTSYYRSGIRNGIIEEDTSEWQSQPVIVSKRGGGKRMAIDFSCTTNKFSKFNAFPVPLIFDLVQRVSRYNCFSVVDITQAYHQVPLAREDMEKTAFEALGKFFHYKRLCFGVRSAVPKFQRIMIKCFGDLEGVFIYLDDVVIGGRT